MCMEEDYVVSERERRAWQESKNAQPIHKRPELNKQERIRFLELFSKMSSRATYERELGLNQSDIEYFKQELGVLTENDARIKFRQMKRDNEESTEARLLEETRKMREAEQVANKRLEELELKKRLDKPEVVIDVKAIQEEDASRQRRFAEQQDVKENEQPVEVWHLELTGSKDSQIIQIEQFKRDIQNRGINFCASKYAATHKQVRYEARRLGLKIDWNQVRRY